MTSDSAESRNIRFIVQARCVLFLFLDLFRLSNGNHCQNISVPKMKQSSAPDATSGAGQSSSSSKPKTDHKARPSGPNVAVVSDPSTLDEKLQLLKQRLDKSFRSEFVGSLCYLISVESQSRCKLDSAMAELDWKRLEYSLNQLKKLCKNKNHLKYLLEKTMIKKAPVKPKVEAVASATAVIKAACPKVSASNLAKTLDQEANDEEYFVLTGIIIRFLLKLYHSKNTSTSNSVAVFDLKLLLLSCLADLCYYEEPRAHVTKVF